MTRAALVTGGSSGLGAALVAELLSRGYRVTSLDRNPPARDNVSLAFRRIDLGDLGALPAAIASLDTTAFDVVIFNAGISAVGAFEDIDPAQLRRLVDINLHAPIELARLLLCTGRVAENGTLVFIASLSNRFGYPGAAVYAATKQGLESFATALRKARRQRVLCVLPGPLDTDHAARYAPAGSKSRTRMAPEHLAARVLSRLDRSGNLYANLPQGLAALAGRLLPAMMTRIMRRALFARLAAKTPVVDAAER